MEVLRGRGNGVMDSGHYSGYIVSIVKYRVCDEDILSKFAVGWASGRASDWYKTAAVISKGQTWNIFRKAGRLYNRK